MGLEDPSQCTREDWEACVCVYMCVPMLTRMFTNILNAVLSYGYPF